MMAHANEIGSIMVDRMEEEDLKVSVTMATFASSVVFLCFSRAKEGTNSYAFLQER